MPASLPTPSERFKRLLDELTQCYQEEMQALADPLAAAEEQSAEQELQDFVVAVETENNGPAPPRLVVSIDDYEGAEDNDLLTGRTSQSQSISDDDPVSERYVNGLELRICWDNFDVRDAIRKTVANIEKSQVEVEDDGDIEDTEQIVGVCKHLIAVPSSTARLMWDLFGAVLIFYDILTIPLDFLNPPPSAFTKFVETLSLLFWTANVAATLTVGYVDKGKTIMSPKKILNLYLRTWFIVDLLTIVPDWTFTFLASGGLDQIKLLRTLRLVRVVRLLRLVKLKKILEYIQDNLNSEYLSLCFSITKMMLVLIVVNHVLACAWYGISAAESGDERWISVYLEDDATFSAKYLISLHWTLTQFTPASMMVQPCNETERFYAVATVLFALVGFAYVVGSMTSSLAQLRQLNEETSKSFWLLRRFLKQRNVETLLALRIKRFLEHAHSRQQETMSIKKVTLLNLLSKQLMEELQTAINLPHLTIHPLLLALSENSFITITRLCTDACRSMSLATKDTLFEAMQAGSTMYFLTTGQVNYTRAHESETLDAGEGWISEPVLWSAQWEHTGELKAATDCEVLAIGAEAFEDIVMLVKPVAATMAKYGRQFVEWITKTNGWSDIIQSKVWSDTLRNFIFTPTQLRKGMSRSFKDSTAMSVTDLVRENGKLSRTEEDESRMD